MKKVSRSPAVHFVNIFHIVDPSGAERFDLLSIGSDTVLGCNVAIFLGVPGCLLGIAMGWF